MKLTVKAFQHLGFKTKEYWDLKGEVLKLELKNGTVYLYMCFIGWDVIMSEKCEKYFVLRNVGVDGASIQ